MNKLSGLFHFPTILLLIGYISYWLELYVIRKGGGRTSLLAWIIAVGMFVFILYSKRKLVLEETKVFFSSYKRKGLTAKLFLCLFLFLIASMAIIICWALILPVHLPQEFDSLNYHITIPRQHLILNSFKHIQWSSADLFLMPLQFALAPYWLVEEIPTKLPQAFFIFGLIFVAINLVRKLSQNNKRAMAIGLLAIMGSHGLGIQFPVLMLDIITCYLFIAALDSLLEGKLCLSALEFCLFFWSKPFFPLQTALLAFAILVSVIIFKKLKFTVTLGFEKERFFAISGRFFKKWLLYFIVFTIMIAGPFMIKSLYYVGTPLFPFFTGVWGGNYSQNPGLWNSILRSSGLHMSTGNAYGSGRSLMDFIRHFWILAVPESGVNNRFDYPLGLPYLLFVGPFFYFFIYSFRSKRAPILALFVIFYWLSWWFGSQQSRFLYIPLVMIFILVSSKLEAFSKIILFCLLLAFLFNCISMFRAHYRDFILPAKEVMREKDKALLEMNKQYHKDKRRDVVSLDYRDVAYAAFPVKVTPVKESDLFWVLE